MASKKKGNINNLKFIKTAEKARELGRAGGIRSGEVKREKKTMRDVFCRYMGYKDEKDFRKHMDGILSNEDSASVQLLKLLHEAEPKDDSSKTEENRNILSEALK